MYFDKLWFDTAQNGMIIGLSFVKIDNTCDMVYEKGDLHSLYIFFISLYYFTFLQKGIFKGIFSLQGHLRN